MLLFILGNIWAAEPKHEILISNENQSSAAATALGLEELATPRISFSYGLSESLSVVTSYGYSQVITNHGASYNDSYGYEEDMYYQSNRFESDFSQHQLHIGPRYLWQLRDWLGLYGKLDGVVSYSSFYAASSLEEKDPNPEIQSDSISFGGALSAGVMGTISLGEKVPVLLLYIERGYRLQTATNYGSLGNLDTSGDYTTLGIGTRF